MSPVAFSSSDDQLPLGEYLFRRIRSLGIGSIFGVPGDFNLGLLEHLYSVQGLKWVGCCNELNSAYSADGYARMSGKLGVVVTTFGVGELSAINGISGAFAEYVPVLHIVGTTPTIFKADGRFTHHLVTDKSVLHAADHYSYENMVGAVSCCAETITHADEAYQKIDHVLSEILYHKRPGYLFVPIDLADSLVDSTSLLTTPGEMFYERPIDPNPSQTLKIATLILDKIYHSSNPCILADVFTDRFDMTETVREFVKSTQIPNFASMMGKGILDETENSYVGSYNGNESNQAIIDWIDSSDLLIHIGDYDNEINSGHDSIHSGLNEIITLNHERIRVCSEIFTDVNFVYVLPAMLALLEKAKIPETITDNWPIDKILMNHPTPVPTPHVSQTDLFYSLQEFLRPNDVLVCDTGSFMFAIPDLVFPQGVKYIGQQFYLSIGYALPATLGVGKALQDMGFESRLILVEGDGAAQMTIQEFGNYIQEGISPTVLLLNNSGYTVERIIKGPERTYNDIVPHWQWCDLFRVFGDYTETKSSSVKVKSQKDLSLALNSIQSGKINMVEVIMDKMDCPWRFIKMTANSKSKV
ncbi:unnamed protein product [Kuraishia capsulata CBS 1993]|uniref:Pyruvate decarboxylase n=1 Tax=Kuraishia capsulata CBS 1993 TaxID=1382522 RepID=W6MUM6_9ASCO|nr:uncharacterized protein KUCA_T00005395001 [Kuraishia capsulata CBS 1993]CDK29407.1 unnamed protein product [Kuraishia capsulata CBS 1993]